MDLITPLAAVALVLTLLCGALILLKRRDAAAFHFPGAVKGSPRRMVIIERTALGPHHTLHLVRIEERSFVVGTSPTSCQLLSELK